MSSFDQNLPPTLQKVQQWFGSIITRPIDFNNQMNPISPSGTPMEIEACQFIVPGPILKPDQRIQIYNQQYWWRLLNTLHELFPLVVRLFGYQSFNQTFGFPYLVQYPPAHWALHTIGNRLPAYISQNYQSDDSQLVYEAALLDCAFTHAFLAEHLPTDLQALAQGELVNILALSLKLQPHFFLFEFHYDLLNFRTALLNETPEFWIENDFPELKILPTYCAVYRNKFNIVTTEILAEDEYRFLKLFEAGISIDEACEWLDEQTDPIFAESNEALQHWFHKWFAQEWLSKAE